MFNNFDFKITKVFSDCEKEMLDLKHNYVGTEHLLLSLLKNDADLACLSKRYGLTYESFKKELKHIVGNSNASSIVLYTPLLKKVINEAINNSRYDNNTLNGKYLFKAIFDEGEGIAIRILLSLNIDIDSLYNEIKLDEGSVSENLEILKIGHDLEKEIDLNETIYNRDKEIDLIIEILNRKNKNNPLLIGEAGVGKTAIVEELTRRIKLKKVPKFLLNKKIVSLELGSLLAGTKYRGEFEEKLTKIIKEIESNPNIIVFIDEIHGIVNAGGAEGAINASDILKPYLARGKIKLIGATTTSEYNKYILKDKALSRRFEIVKVLEPSVDETIDILSKMKKSFEKYYNFTITKDNIKDVVLLTNKYIPERKNPDKSLDILDSVCSMVSVQGECSKDYLKIDKKIKYLNKCKKKSITDNNYEKASLIREKILDLENMKSVLTVSKTGFKKSDILELLSKKCNIPIVEDKNFLLDKLNKELKRTIIGQDEAIDKIINNIKYHDKDLPLSLLLTGKTGVGKTETVKTIAKILNTNLIRLDMSEYNLDISASKLIGSSPGYVGYNDETIFNQIKMYPYSIILVDELEKSSPAVMNLFLQIMDEGILTNSLGEKIDFKNTLIFMTSNAKGSKKIGFNNELIDYSEDFSKEFLARFDDIITFKGVDEKMVEKYLKKNNVKDMSIIKKIDYEKYGFREIKKFLKKNYLMAK